MLIRPFIGMHLLYRPADEDRNDIRHCAIVASILGADIVNVGVFDANGVMYNKQNVKIADTDDNPVLGECEHTDNRKGPFIDPLMFKVPGIALASNDEVVEEVITDDDLVVTPVDNSAFIDIAEYAHNVNRLYCKEHGLDIGIEWEELSKGEIEGRVYAVLQVCDNPAITAEDLHQIWLESKEDNGWRLGTTLSHKDKTHPDMILFDDLSPVVQQKDQLFIDSVLEAIVK